MVHRWGRIVQACVMYRIKLNGASRSLGRTGTCRSSWLAREGDFEPSPPTPPANPLYPIGRVLAIVADKRRAVRHPGGGVVSREYARQLVSAGRAEVVGDVPLPEE
jgi:hypothetical protein